MANKDHILQLLIKARDYTGPTLKQVRANLLSVGVAGKQVRQGLTDIGMAATLAGTALAAMGAAFLLPLGQALRVSQEFEHAMNGVRAVANATGGEFAALTDKARELGASTQFTAKEAADGMKFLAMTGYNAGQIMTSIEPMLRLAAAANMDLARAADIVSNIMQGFQLPAEKAAEVTNTLAVIASRANTNIEQLGDAMKYAAPTAAATGLTLGQTAAAIGVMSDAGIQASMAGTSLRRIMLRLVAPSKAAADALAELGVEVAKNKDNSLDLATTMERLDDAGLSAAQATKIFGIYAVSAGLAMSNATAKMRDLEWQSLADIDALDRMVKVMTGDLWSALVRVKSAFEALGNALGGPWLETLRNVADGFANIVRGLASFLQKHEVLAGAISGLVGVVGLLALGIGGAAAAMGAITFLVGTLQGAVARATAFWVAHTTAVTADTIATTANTVAKGLNSRAVLSWGSSITVATGQTVAATTATAASTAATSAATASTGLLASAWAALSAVGTAVSGVLSTIGSILAGISIAAVGLGAALGLVAAKLFDWVTGSTAPMQEMQAQTDKLIAKYSKLKKEFDELKEKGQEFKPLPAGVLAGMDADKLDDYSIKLEKYYDMVRTYQEALINKSNEFKGGVTDFLFGDFGEATDEAKRAKKALGQLTPLLDYIHEARRNLANVKTGTAFAEDAEAAGDAEKQLGAFVDQWKDLQEILGTSAKEAKKNLQSMDKETARSVESMRSNFEILQRTIGRFKEDLTGPLEKFGDAWISVRDKAGASLTDQTSAFNAYSGVMQSSFDQTVTFFTEKSGDVQSALRAALEGGSSSKELVALRDNFGKVAEQGIQAYEMLRDRAVAALKSLQSKHEQVVKAIEELEKRHNQDLQSLTQSADDARRSILNRSLTEEEKYYERRQYLQERLLEAKRLEAQGDEDSLKRAQELRKAIIQQAQSLKSVQDSQDKTNIVGNEQAQADAIGLIDAAEQAYLVTAQRVEEEKRTALEATRTEVDRQTEAMQKLREAAEGAARTLRQEMRVTIDDADAKVRLAKLQEERRVQYVVELEVDEQRLKDARQKIKDALSVKVQPGEDTGVLPGFAKGGKFIGAPGVDKNIVALTTGEYIINDRATSYYGDRFMAALNAMKIPLSTFSGIIPSISSQIGGTHFAEGGKVGLDSLAWQIADGIQSGLNGLMSGFVNVMSASIRQIQSGQASQNAPQMFSLSAEVVERLGQIVSQFTKGLEDGTEVDIKVHSDGSATVTGGGKVRLY